MTTAYSPLHFMEALARERRRHRDSPAGEGATPSSITTRQRVGRTVMRLGRRLMGDRSDAMPRTTAA